MLEGLDEIDWKNCNAEEVPKRIRDLASPHKHIYLSACDYLEDHVIKINHQDYDSGKRVSKLWQTDLPLVVAPFLLELLRIDDMPARAEIFGMLISLACYRNMLYEGDIYQEFNHQLSDIVKKGMELYQQLLKADNPMVRSQAASILSFYPEDAQVIIPLLEHALTQEQDVSIKEWLNKSLKRIKKSEPDDSPS